MKKLVSVLAVYLAGVSRAFAQQAGETGGGIDEAINAVIAPVSNTLAGIIFYSVPVGEASLPLIVVWLVVAAAFFTVYFGFISFRAFKHAMELIRGDYENPEDAGEVSHFQALATALSGTVGLGNIAGVAIAVSIGGPGATFWMIVAGILGMSAKFCECTLGVRYRNEYEDGTVSGGPMYYLSKGFKEKKAWAGLGQGPGGILRYLLYRRVRSAAAICFRRIRHSSSSSMLPAARTAFSPTRAGCSGIVVASFGGCA